MDAHFAVSFQIQNLRHPHPRKVPGSTQKWQEGIGVALTHRPGIWLNEEVLEYPLVIDQYELGMSLLLLQNASPVAEIDEEPVEDAFDHFMKPNQR